MNIEPTSWFDDIDTHTSLCLCDRCMEQKRVTQAKGVLQFEKKAHFYSEMVHHLIWWRNDIRTVL